METEGLHASSCGSFGILYFDNHHGETWTSLCWLRSKFGSSSQPQHPCGQKLKASISTFILLHTTSLSSTCAVLYMIIPAGGAVYLKPNGTKRHCSPKCAFVGFIHLRQAAETIYEITNFSCDTNKGDQDGSYRQTFCNCCFVESNAWEGYYLYFQLQLVFVTFFPLSLFENKTLAILGGIFCWQKNNWTVINVEI